MRRSSTRKPAAAVPSTGARAAAKELERIDFLFGLYSDKNEDPVIGPDGIEQLCRDLGMDPTDVQVLLLAWKLRAARQGYFTLDEWRKGLKAMRVDTIDKLKKALPGLQLEVANPDVFRDFYTFAFQYCLTEPRQKTLDVESSCQMLELILGNQPHVPSFIQFLQINDDLSNYDENHAWPLLLDNYVEWARK